MPQQNFIMPGNQQLRV
jgi:hypothetical protein